MQDQRHLMGSFCLPVGHLHVSSTAVSEYCGSYLGNNFCTCHLRRLLMYMYMPILQAANVTEKWTLAPQTEM